MKVLTLGVKGWKDERSGLWHWTPEIVCEFDPLYPTLDKHQQEMVQNALASEMEAIMNAVEVNEPKVQQEAPVPPVKAEPEPSALREQVVQRKAVDGYDPEAKKWRRCVCGNENINFVSAKTGQPYQACNECNIFLQADGKVKAKGGAR